MSISLYDSIPDSKINEVINLLTTNESVFLTAPPASMQNTWHNEADNTDIPYLAALKHRPVIFDIDEQVDEIRGFLSYIPDHFVDELGIDARAYIIAIASADDRKNEDVLQRLCAELLCKISFHDSAVIRITNDDESGFYGENSISGLLELLDFHSMKQLEDTGTKGTEETLYMVAHGRAADVNHGELLNGEVLPRQQWPESKAQAH